MDIPRTKQRSYLRKSVTVVLAIAGIAVVVYLGQLPSALPSIDSETLLIGTVERGVLNIEVKANGTLQPVDLRIITAQSTCVVAQIHAYPGAVVHPETLIAELDSPELEQATHDALWQMRSAEADYQLQRLDQKTAVEIALGAEKEARAKMDAYVLLKEKGLYHDNSIEMLRVRVALEQEDAQLAAAKSRLRFFERDGDTIAPAKAKLEQARSMYELKKSQLAALHVRAGMDGILQQLPIQVGERCTIGSTLAIVAKPTPLKAVLKVDQIQAKDVSVGLAAVVDTYNGKVPGSVIRTDPSIRNGTMTVDVALAEKLPPGARPDLSVEGTVLVQDIPNAVFVKRPSLAQANSVASVFKILEGGHEAVRVPVRYGPGSENRLEVVEGLAPGERIILSDTSALGEANRVRLR
ncbi:HlyD family efflux transporter periplasmic adaptor subunit [Xanthomonas nasturtii]|uniref:efflux RND transporter periplasmic adaptor subunit n=1 Tax=Xanthomonas nasturtii TaxID=1843581 RepID=UPI002B226579|nr:HlyD family efflux transporter periplasmic adaptor subunit [Xanthomonas nasturtii]MEA9580417.1 HlyD family efflux transporter periplasmic adaptor subunit [Xanthomonas nasturtii]